MALHAATARFEVRKLKRGEGWYVLVTWPNGSSAMIHDLASKAEAEEWIKNKSSAWLKARLTGSHD